MKVLMGISGGIAASKALDIARLVVKSGGEVRVVLTPHALEFVTLTTVEALTGHEAYWELFPRRRDQSIAHIELAKWPDVLLLAPATANLIGKIANGICDDLLTTTVCALGSRVPLVLAPAMNTQMWLNPAVQRNVAALARDYSGRFHQVGPVEKLLACGDSGIGGMASPEDIYSVLDTARTASPS